MTEDPSPTARPAEVCPGNDLVATRWSLAIWWICGAAIIAGFSTPHWRPLLWICGMGISGALCVVNAVRCHRMHCYITGPVFLLGALLTALNIAGVTAIPWQWLGLGVVIGVVAGMVIENFTGRYAGK